MHVEVLVVTSKEKYMGREAGWKGEERTHKDSRWKRGQADKEDQEEVKSQKLPCQRRDGGRSVRICKEVRGGASTVWYCPDIC